jgi:hypothetical protein
MDATRYIDLIHAIAAAEQAGDEDAALIAARNLRAAVDGLCQQMTLAQFTVKAKAKADLARILTSEGLRGGK